MPEDAVDGAAMTVTPCKGVNKGECLRCFYIRRGSFKNVESGMLRGLLKKNANLRDKLLGIPVFLKNLKPPCQRNLPVALVGEMRNLRFTGTSPMIEKPLTYRFVLFSVFLFEYEYETILYSISD